VRWRKWQSGTWCSVGSKSDHQHLGHAFEEILVVVKASWNRSASAPGPDGTLNDPTALLRRVRNDDELDCRHSAIGARASGS
jgi:hypothetical protein